MSEKNDEEKPSNPDRDLKRLKVEYAWKYFEYHAKQRTTVFNFFILFSGILFAALTVLLDDDKHLLLIIFSFFGLIITLCFLNLERRNQELVTVGEMALIYLESGLFEESYENDCRLKQIPRGLLGLIPELWKLIFNDLTRDRIDEEIKKKFPGIEKNPTGPLSLGVLYNTKYRHAIWLPAIYKMIAICYFSLMLWGVCIRFPYLLPQFFCNLFK